MNSCLTSLMDNKFVEDGFTAFFMDDFLLILLSYLEVICQPARIHAGNCPAIK